LREFRENKKKSTVFCTLGARSYNRNNNKKDMTAEIQKIHKGKITLNDVQDKIITIQNKNVLLDSDVAWLYGVETKRVNEAVSNNPDKFPAGYIISLDKDEWQILKSKFSTSSWGGKNKLPNAFRKRF